MCCVHIFIVTLFNHARLFPPDPFQPFESLIKISRKFLISSLGFCVVFPARYATVLWRGTPCDKGALGMLIWFIQMYLSAKSLNLSASASLCPSRSPLPKARSSVRDAQVQLFPPVSRKQAVCAKCEELHILSLAPPGPETGPLVGTLVVFQLSLESGLPMVW